MRGILERANLDWRGALANADIDIDAVNRLGGTIPARKELAFQLQFAALTRDRVDLWIEAARTYTLSSMGEHGMAILAAPTVEAWVELVCTTDIGYGLHEIGPLRAPDLSVAGIELIYRGVPEALVPYGIHRDVVWIVRTLSMLYGKPFPVTYVEFPPAGISPEISTYLPSEVTCGSEALRIWWDPAASTCELPFGNAFQYETWAKAENRIIDALISSGDWPATVAKAMRDAPQLNRNLENVAAALHTSPRTLQRKLALVGSTFAQIRDQTLTDLASEMLSNTGHSIGRISRELGYTDPASFTIAFKRWKGVPPTAYREAARYEKTNSSDE
nr:AraC family transcriptional regulator [Rhodococcus sp. 14C212]